MNRYTEEMKLWLFDLAHGDLKRSDIITGFIKHYVLHDCTLQDVKRDMVFHTNYGQDGLVMALDSLTAALESLTSEENSRERIKTVEEFEELNQKDIEKQYDKMKYCVLYRYPSQSKRLMATARSLEASRRVTRKSGKRKNRTRF